MTTILMIIDCWRGMVHVGPRHRGVGAGLQTERNVGHVPQIGVFVPTDRERWYTCAMHGEMVQVCHEERGMEFMCQPSTLVGRCQRKLPTICIRSS